jgi:putative aldouronate transport system permease protein
MYLRQWQKKMWKNRTLWLMLAPAMAFVILFAYIPMAGSVLAFKDYSYSLGIFKSPWAGLNNFKFFFVSGDAFHVTRNTFLYNLTFIVLNTSLEILFAVILSEIGGRFFKKLVQGSMFLPYFISWVVVGSISYNLFNFENGTVNNLIRALGGETINIYNQPRYWPFIIVAFSSWKMVGYGTVIYLASIAGIDPELNQAAEIDGASIFQRIRYVTIPSILPTVVILVLLEIGRIFRGDFGLFYQLVGNNGAIFNVTDVIDTYVFRSLISSTRLGMSAAVGFYQSVLCFITIMLANAAVKRIEPDYVLF